MDIQMEASSVHCGNRHPNQMTDHGCGNYPPGPVDALAFIFLDVSSSIPGVDTL